MKINNVYILLVGVCLIGAAFTDTEEEDDDVQVEVEDDDVKPEKVNSVSSTISTV
jgi:hypothetical protein